MNKLKENIIAKIKQEINQSIIDCAHGINNDNVDKYLIPPIKEKYAESINTSKYFYLWTVLEEDPEEKKGYTIFYDEVRNDFGLGTHTNNGLVYLGNCGTFIETLNSM